MLPETGTYPSPKMLALLDLKLHASPEGVKSESFAKMVGKSPWLDLAMLLFRPSKRERGRAHRVLCDVVVLLLLFLLLPALEDQHFEEVEYHIGEIETLQPTIELLCGAERKR